MTRVDWAYREWVVSPESIIWRAGLQNMITSEEAVSPVFLDAARQAAEDLRDSWSEGEGFGSSDFTFLLQKFLEIAEIKTEFVNGRLTRV